MQEHGLESHLDQDALYADGLAGIATVLGVVKLGIRNVLVGKEALQLLGNKRPFTNLGSTVAV
jgi:hypothetical protein